MRALELKLRDIRAFASREAEAIPKVGRSLRLSSPVHTCLHGCSRPSASLSAYSCAPFCLHTECTYLINRWRQ